jgi:serine/threonine protein kinase
MVQALSSSAWSLPVVGETIAGKYAVEGECGRGATSVVFAARHASLDRRVAIKMLLPEWAGQREAVSRFLREARAAARIESEHVVRVFDMGVDRALPYVALEYLEGLDLQALLDVRGPARVATAVEWILQAAEGIADAHSVGVVHGDLRLANLFLTRAIDGSPCIKVIDFRLPTLDGRGVAEPSAAASKGLLTSLLRAAPERLRARDCTDERTDVWGLGIALYELIVGQPPFRANNLSALLKAVQAQPVPAISSVHGPVAAEVGRAIRMCLEKEPRARFASMKEMSEALAPHGVALPHGWTSYNRSGANRDSHAPMASGTFSVDLGEPKVAARASAKVVLLAVFLLTLLGLFALGGLYASVHGNPLRSHEASVRELVTRGR